jgi:hypothetical protein
MAGSSAISLQTDKVFAKTLSVKPDSILCQALSASELTPFVQLAYQCALFPRTDIVGISLSAKCLERYPQRF